jgi:hypothetical protein
LNSIIPFVGALLLVALVATAIGTSILPVQPSALFQIVIFLTISTGGLFIYLLQTKRERPGYFVQFYLLTMAVKLTAYAGFMIFVIMRDREGARLNVITFLIVYLLFTALEIAFLYRKVNSNQ